jgi:hypothetical protein
MISKQPSSRTLQLTKITVAVIGRCTFGCRHEMKVVAGYCKKPRLNSVVAFGNRNGTFSLVAHQTSAYLAHRFDDLVRNPIPSPTHQRIN